MSPIQLTLRPPASAFEPGETLQGQVTWRLDAAPQWLEIRLLWETTGKAASESSCVQTVRIDRPPLNGSQSFAFTLRPGPCTFNGHLVSLQWFVEASAASDADPVRHPIIVAPGREGIVLG